MSAESTKTSQEPIADKPNLYDKSQNKGRYRRKILPYNPILKTLAKQLRQNSTVAEIILWGILKNGKMHGFDFDRQRPIDNYIVDFYCKDLMLAIEIDGITHDSYLAQKKDEKRQIRLEDLGVRFLRFSDYEVRNNLEGVYSVIDEWISDHGDEFAGRIETD